MANNTYIHIAIGTKAQFIKMAPIMHELSRRKITFNFIDLGQHALITKNLRKEFDIKDPDVILSQGSNISTLWGGILWMCRLFIRGFNRKRLKKEVFQDQGGVCLIHGDTVSTLLSLYLARRAGLKVAHVEAGLRSFNIFEPFPEEIVRLITMRFCDYLFAPSKWAMENLKKMGYCKKAVLLAANTSLESAYYSFNKKEENLIDVKDYALITVHRMENIFSRKKLEEIIDFIEKLSRNIRVVFVQHPPTLNRLKKFGLQSRLADIKNLTFSHILSHAQFIHLIAGCKFLITDGGSIQEEAYYFDKPCLLLRSRTERMEGLGENVYLSRIKRENLDYFVQHYGDFKRKGMLDDAKPSAQLLNYLLNG